MLIELRDSLILLKQPASTTFISKEFVFYLLDKNNLSERKKNEKEEEKLGHLRTVKQMPEWLFSGHRLCCSTIWKRKIGYLHIAVAIVAAILQVH